MTRFAAVLLLVVALGGALVLLSTRPFPARTRKIIASAGWFLLYAAAALVFLMRIF